MSFSKTVLILLLWVSNVCSAQVLTDPTAKEWVLACVQHTYNYDFKKAEEYQKKIQARYPQHPVGSLLMASILYWKHLPLNENDEAVAKYLSALTICQKQAEALLKKPALEVEATFFMLASQSFRTMIYADTDQMMSAVGEARRAFAYLKKGKELLKEEPEFYFSTGLYNYYVEQYPKDHPVVKPFMFFFADGNKTLGLQQLALASQKAIFTKTEAAYYLIYIYVKHENLPQNALAIAQNLHDKYPNNPLYLCRYTEILILNGKYAEAEKKIENLRQLAGEIYPLAADVFMGMIQEKYHKNNKTAEQFYKNALKIPFNERFTKAYHAFAYLGLGKIALNAGSKNLAKNYLKQALKLAEYKAIKVEIAEIEETL